jgi:hypothetical protein
MNDWDGLERRRVAPIFVHSRYNRVTRAEACILLRGWQRPAEKSGMARYIQRITLLGRQKWIGWEIDGVGTEIPGLILADDLPEEDLLSRGIKEFKNLPFESFLEMNPQSQQPADGSLLDEDVEFRLDALQVSIDRLRSRGEEAVPKALLMHMFGSSIHLNHPRVIKRLQEWEQRGAVEFVGRDECYLRIVGRM